MNDQTSPQQEMDEAMDDATGSELSRCWLGILGIVLVVFAWILGFISLLADWELPGLGAAFALFVAGIVLSRLGARRARLWRERLNLILGLVICAEVATVFVLFMSLDFTRVW